MQNLDRSFSSRIFISFSTFSFVLCYRTDRFLLPTPVLSGAFMPTLKNMIRPDTVSLKLIPSFQCVDGLHGVDQSNTAGRIGWQCEAFDQDIVKIEFH